MKRLVSPGLYTLPLTLFAGVWVSIAPFVMQTQPAASAWSTSTINGVVTGGILIGVSLVGIWGHLLCALRDLVRSDPEPETQAQQAI